jgi:hypothetical protein
MLTKLELSGRKKKKKTLNIRFHQNPSSGSQVILFGWMGKQLQKGKMWGIA